MMKMIILKRLMEIKENLEELIPQLDPNSRVYKDAKDSLRRINKSLSSIHMSDLPKNIKIDTSKLRFKGDKLYGKVLMTDNRNVYFITVNNNEIKDMKVFKGGIKKMEYLEATAFKNN